LVVLRKRRKGGGGVYEGVRRVGRVVEGRMRRVGYSLVVV
jgi:hypothetical protein